MPTKSEFSFKFGKYEIPIDFKKSYEIAAEIADAHGLARAHFLVGVFYATGLGGAPRQQVKVSQENSNLIKGIFALLVWIYGK